jgi:alpha-beta hydrolase superfamily lysophospholipase
LHAPYNTLTRTLVLVILSAVVFLPGSQVSAHPAGAERRVTLRTTDGVRLRGWLWGSGQNAVVLSHMFGTDQSIWYELARKLAANGFTAITYDFRGVGTSGGRLVIARVDRDVLAAIRFMRTRHPRRLFLVGASMGGTASLVAAGQHRVDGLVIMASGMRFQGLDARPHLGDLRAAKLFIVGRGDAPFNESARSMYARTPSPKELKVIPTNAHGTYMFKTRHGPAVEQAILTFLTNQAR